MLLSVGRFGCSPSFICALIAASTIACASVERPRGPVLSPELPLPVVVPAVPEHAETGLTQAVAAPVLPALPLREGVSPSSAVILVVIDGVRWQEIFHGPEVGLARRQWMLGKLPKAPELVPTMYRRFFGGGVAIGGKGAGFTASGPVFVSLPGYLEIMTGRIQRSCSTNHCEPTAEPTIADEVRALPGSKLEDVAVISSWEVIDRAASKVRVESTTPWLDPTLHDPLGELLDTYDFGLIP